MNLKTIFLPTIYSNIIFLMNSFGIPKLLTFGRECKHPLLSLIRSFDTTKLQLGSVSRYKKSCISCEICRIVKIMITYALIFALFD